MRKIFGTRNWYAQKWIIILFSRDEFYEIHLCRSFSLILIDVFHHVSNYFRICHDFHQRSRFLIPSVLIIPEKKKMQSVNYGTNRGWNCCASKTNVETGREKEKETALPSVEFYSLCWHDMRQTCLHVYIYIYFVY